MKEIDVKKLINDTIEEANPEKDGPTLEVADPGIAVFATEDGTVKVETRIVNGSIWLSQALMAQLYGVSKQTISYHLKEIFSEGELSENSVVKDFLTTATDGKNYQIKFYNLDVIIHVGYRIKSAVGAMFRAWATERLKEYMVKGFTMDDDRFKYGDGYDHHFDELLERIRDIRSSERVFYRKVRDVISESSTDYSRRKNEIGVKNFFAHLQDCMLNAVTGNTAAEIKCYRADASKPNMGLTSFRGDSIVKADVDVAKNYLLKNELEKLNRLVSMFIDYAEDQAERRHDMTLDDWMSKTSSFLIFNEYPVLTGFGKRSSEQASKHVHEQLRLYRERLSLMDNE